MLKLKLYSNSSADNWGVVLSILCALHCLTLPFMALASPFLKHYLDSNLVHVALFVALLPISFVAFIKQKKHHQKLTPTVLASIGLFFLLIGIVSGYESGNHNHDSYIAEVFSAVGSVLLITAHLLNLKHLRNCRKCSHH